MNLNLQPASQEGNARSNNMGESNDEKLNLILKQLENMNHSISKVDERTKLMDGKLSAITNEIDKLKTDNEKTKQNVEDQNNKII